MRFVIWMLRLYPLKWRERYGAEMVALLEQHSITLWTMVDLLFGALDARLDPYYHQERPSIPQLPWRGLQSSWHLMLTAFATFWLTLILWLSGGGAWGPLSFSWSATDVTLLLGSLAYLSLPFILAALVGWVGWQAGRNAWHLLRLVPVALFIQLLLLPPWLDGWQNAALWLLFLLSLAGTASTIGAMLTSFTRWEKRINLPVAIGARLCALALISGMTLLCIINVSWMSMFWSSSWNTTISPYWWYGPVTLTLELVTMALATLLAFCALVRSLLELQGLYRTQVAQALPGQEILPAFSHFTGHRLFDLTMPAALPNLPSPPPKSRVHPLAWLIITPLLLGIFTISLTVIANFTYTFTTTIPDSLVSTLLLSGGLASLSIALVVSIDTKKQVHRPRQARLIRQIRVAHERQGL